MPSCNGGNNGSIDITVIGGVSPYTFAWSNGAVTEDPTGLSAGTYSVIVTDAVLCTDTFFVSVNEPSLITSSVLLTNPGCQGSADGSINLSVSGGTPGYTYLWDNGAVSEDISGLTQGLYSVSITDANGCTSNNFGVLTDPGPFTLTANSYHESCFGLNNGAIDISASNDTMNITNPGLLISEFLADPAGADSSKEWVELIATKFIDFSQTPYTVILANNGTATTNGWVQGGVASATTNGTYAFQISSGIVVPGDIVYIGGNAMAVNGNKVRVIDITSNTGDGGIGTATTGGVLGNGTTNADAIGVFYGPASSLTPASVPADAIFYGLGTGSAVVSGGTAGFTLPVNDAYNGGYLQSGSFLAPNPGTSRVKATGGYNTLTGSFTPRVWTTDTTITDGISAISVTSGNTYLWSTGATTEDINGLSGGPYTVTVTSGTGCTASLSVTINSASFMSTSAVIFDVTCFGLNDGAIDVTASGGASPYTYLWNDGDINEDKAAVTAGVYVLTLTDANGCMLTDTFIVNQPNDLTYTAVVTNTSCVGASDGAIDLTVTGGTQPYTFGWSTGAITEDILNQPASFYFFNITDANNCGIGGFEFINDPAPIGIFSFTPITGGSGVSVTINGTGFTTANSVLFNGVPAASFNIISDFQIDAIVPAGAGTGVITVASSISCFTVSVDTFTYNPVACVPPTLSALSFPASCFGASDGSIDLSVTGGLPPYTFIWSNGANSEDIAGLTAGIYSVIVSDAASCPDTLTVTVGEPALLQITGVTDSVSCFGFTDGSIDVTVNGGTAPFTFNWSNGAISEDITGLSTGTYTLIVVDTNFCAATTSFDVYEPLPLSVSPSTVNPNCAGQASGSIDPGAGGGTLPFTYLWSNGYTYAILDSVSAGTYSVTVTDANGCSISASATLTDPAPFTLSLVTATDVTCPAGNDGAIDIAASNDPVLPPVNPGLLISEFLPDPAGTDHPFEWVELVATKPIDFSLTPYTVVVANNGTATVKGWRQGGTITYAFQISSGVVSTGDVFYVGGSSMAPTGTKLRTINTQTTAGDGFGSPNGGGIGNSGTNADAVAVFNVASALIDSSTVPVDAVFFGTGLGAAIVNGGLNGYTLPNNDNYSGGLLSTGAYLAPNSASGSTLVATGAFNITTGVYTTPRSWTLNPAFTDGVSSVNISASNTYVWSNAATSQDISGLSAGTYTVTATNASGCTAGLSVTITAPDSLTILSFTPSSGSIGTPVTISGFNFTYADEVLFNGVSASFTIDNANQITATVPLGAGTGSITIINTGCDTINSASPFTLVTLSATLNLTLLIEGFHAGSGVMQPVLLNSGVGLSATECDTIYVELRDQLTPTTVLAGGTAVMDINGQSSFTFPASVIGQNGYIAVFHRNAVQTWSDLVTFSGAMSYNFTTAATQAYGANMTQVAPGLWAFYSGDLSPQDEFIDLIDQGVIDNDIFNFAGGYVVSDLSGDGFVDLVDQSIVDNNIFNFIGSVHP